MGSSAHQIRRMELWPLWSSNPVHGVENACASNDIKDTKWITKFLIFYTADWWRQVVMCRLRLSLRLILLPHWVHLTDIPRWIDSWCRVRSFFDVNRISLRRHSSSPQTWDLLWQRLCCLWKTLIFLYNCARIRRTWASCGFGRYGHIFDNRKSRFDQTWWCQENFRQNMTRPCRVNLGRNC